jgi:prepilin-type N-terminal cleavage/methylation domain-containing protein
MLHHNHKGFTIIELLISIVAGSVIVVLSLGLFSNLYGSFLKSHEDSLKNSDLSLQSQRIARVLRGASSVVSADSLELVLYAYFSPRDNVVSLVKYYKSGGDLRVDVTPMTSNPPTGSPILVDTKTYTIVDEPNPQSSTNIFEYLNSAGTILSVPVASPQLVKGIRINLSVSATPPITTKPTTIVTSVTLRNRKTNL